MKITININTDNAAFDEDFPEFEVIRILNKLTEKLEHNGLNCEYPLIDLNGNKVGELKIND